MIKRYYGLFLHKISFIRYRLSLLHIDEVQFYKRQQTNQRRYFLFSLLALMVTSTPYDILIIIVYFVVCFTSPFIDIHLVFKHQRQRIQYLFPIWLRQLQVLLQENTVLNAIEISIETAPIMLRVELQNLVTALKEENHNKEVYQAFMNHFKMFEIHRAMKLLYRFQMVGSQDSQYQFDQMIAMTSKWLRKQRFNHQENSLQINQWIGMVPLIGVTLIFMVLMFMVMIQMLERR